MGVTSALNAIPKQAIPYWAARTVAETAVENVDVLKDLVEKDPEGAIRWLKGSPWSKRDKAADIGTAVHLIAELDASGDTVEADQILATLDPVGKEKAKQVRAFFASVPCEITPRVSSTTTSTATPGPSTSSWSSMNRTSSTASRSPRAQTAGSAS